MNKYNGLLKSIAKELNILQGKEESILSLKSRIIYSAIGHVTYASLFDRVDNEQAISIVHFKRRCKDLVKAYQSMYPEIITTWEISDDDFSDMLYDLFYETGNIYHSPNRISPAIFRKTVCNNIVFLRGISITQKTYRSGWGSYCTRRSTDSQDDALMPMFNISRDNLLKRWTDVINKAHWTQMSFPRDIEYLRINPPFTDGYFTNSFNYENTITLARIGFAGQQAYYLCRRNNGNLEYSPLEDWLTADMKYINLANGCLAYYGKLPKIYTCDDGNNVIVELSYWLPPAEQNLFELYSWPYYMNKNNLSFKFKRIFPSKVFDVFRELFVKIGYQLAEV